MSKWMRGWYQGQWLRWCIVVLGVLGGALGGRLSAQLLPEPPTPPAPPAVDPGGDLGIPGGGGGIGGDKLAPELVQALARIFPGATENALEVLEELGIDADTRLRVVVEVTFEGDAGGILDRVIELGGMLEPTREVAAVQGLLTRVPLYQLPVLAEEPDVVRIGTQTLLAESLPADPNFSVGPPLLTIPDQALAGIHAAIREKATWTPRQRKLEGHLVMAAKRARNEVVAGGSLDRVPLVLPQDNEGRVGVEIRVTSVNESLVARVQSLGGTLLGRVDNFGLLQAWVPLAQLEVLAAEAEVQSIRRYIPPVSRRSRGSEGDVRHRSDRIRDQFGYDGTGVTVGVLSNGVDSLATRQAAGDLPAEITVLPGQHGKGDEGTAVLEILNDLAPGARLMFATGFPSEAQMARNVLDLAAAGCDILVDDLGFLLAPAFQDGIAAQAVETVYDGGMIYFSAAGNAGNFDRGTSGLWEGDFRPAPSSIEGQDFVLHDFGDGQLTNGLNSDPATIVSLQWADPWGASGNDYDLVMLDETGSEIIAISNSVQDGTGDPIEFIDSQLDDHSEYRLVIVQADGADRFVRLDTFGTRLERVTPGQVFGHPAAEHAMAVGAVFQGNGSLGPGYFDGDEGVESFSSDGPRRLFFDAAGEPLTPGDFMATGGRVRLKPEFVAADGVSTNTPFFEQFFGTSAAAPHAAGIAALLVQRGVRDPGTIRRLFESTALDVESPGVDRLSGYGIIDGFRAITVPIGGTDILVQESAEAIPLPFAQLLLNDLPGAGAGSLAVTGVTERSASGGICTLVGETIVYSPPSAAFRGVDTFEYTLTEGGNLSVSVPVSLEILEPVPPRLAIRLAEPGELELVLAGGPGRTVVVEKSQVFGDTIEWLEAGTSQLDAEGTGRLTVTPSGGFEFYRARW